MDSHVDLDEAQRKADEFLLSQREAAAGKSLSPQQEIRNITNLAFDRGNPVAEFFSKATSTDRFRINTTPALKSKSSKLFGLGRSKPKHGASERRKPAASVHSSEPTTLDETTVHGVRDAASRSSEGSRKDQSRNGSPLKKFGASNSGKAQAETKQIPGSSSFSVSEKPAKTPSSLNYVCIICEEHLSSKGVCKRHLEDQHVQPKIYKCEKCGESFKKKADANQHVGECGKGVFFWTRVKSGPQKLYACDLTGQSFSSSVKYVESLLSLSVEGENRPRSSPHNKLYALLSQPNLLPHVEKISSAFYNDTCAWRALRWRQVDLIKAIKCLDHAVVHENSSIEMGNYGDHPHETVGARSYLETLLRSGIFATPQTSPATTEEMTSYKTPRTQRSCSTLSSPASRGTTLASTQSDRSHTPTTHSNVSQGSLIMSSTPTGPTAIDTVPMTQEVKEKRHLSDHSRAFVPVRQPPGPPNALMVPTAMAHPMNVNIWHPLRPLIPPASPMPPPYRSSDGFGMVHSPANSLTPTRPYDMSAAVSVASSDGASERTQSTLVSDHREPVLQNTIPFDCNWAWQPLPHIQTSLPFDNTIQYDLTCTPNYPSGDVSIRTSSVATENTYVGYIDEEEQKQMQIDIAPLPLPPHGHDTNFGTFLFDDNERHDTYNSVVNSHDHGRSFS